MIGFLWRLFGRRLGWLAAGALGRVVLRVVTDREVNRTAGQLEERLPSSVRAVTQRLPGDPVKTGAQALVVGRSLRRATHGSFRAARAANDGCRALVKRAGQATDQVGRLAERAAVVGDLGQDIRREAEFARRELHADRLRSQGAGQVSVDDALLDLRDRDDVLGLGHQAVTRATDGDTIGQNIPLAQIPEPIRTGRRRARKEPRKLVQRVQRNYRPPTRPWDN